MGYPSWFTEDQVRLATESAAQAIKPAVKEIYHEKGWRLVAPTTCKRKVEQKNGEMVLVEVHLPKGYVLKGSELERDYLPLTSAKSGSKVTLMEITTDKMYRWWNQPAGYQYKVLATGKFLVFVEVYDNGALVDETTFPMSVFSGNVVEA